MTLERGEKTGSKAWWRVQSCEAEKKHRGMPGRDGAWTAKWDGDDDGATRRPCKLLSFTLLGTKMTKHRTKGNM
jgi:hypothetical protein